MRVSFFNTYLQGGAASAAIDLFQSLQLQAFESVFYYRRDMNNEVSRFQGSFVKRDYPSIGWLRRITDPIKARLHYQRIRRYEAGKPNGFEQFSFSKQFYQTPYSFFGDLPDVLHLHWVAEWLDYPSFFDSLPDELPIVWTLHDMNAFTGGCHYSWDCQQYLSVCRACPQLGPYENGKLVMESWTAKEKAISRKNLHIVADSQWIEEGARKSGLLKYVKSFRTIHYGVDSSVFKPLSMQRTNGSFKLAFGAASFDNKRKGFQVLIEALKYLHKRNHNLECIVFGSGKIDNLTDLPPFRFVGVVDHEQLANVYNEADLFVIPSLEEAFGQTSLEAMSCGRPVVGFNTGGIPDTVIHGQTGLLARRGDSVDLADQIETLIKNPEFRLKLGLNAATYAMKNFSLVMQRNKYIDLYHSLYAA